MFGRPGPAGSFSSKAARGGRFSTSRRRRWWFRLSVAPAAAQPSDQGGSKCGARTFGSGRRTRNARRLPCRSFHSFVRKHSAGRGRAWKRKRWQASRAAAVFGRTAARPQHRRQQRCTSDRRAATSAGMRWSNRLRPGGCGHPLQRDRRRSRREADHEPDLPAGRRWQHRHAQRVPPRGPARQGTGSSTTRCSSTPISTATPTTAST
jgi:hypothetical protein